MKETKFKKTLVQTKEGSRHCEERCDVAIQGGFKMTEVGMIPNDWEVFLLSELCSKIFSGKNKEKHEIGNYLVYGSTGVLGYSNKFAYDKPAILIARVGANAGIINEVDGKYDVSDNTLIVYGISCCQHYIYEFLKFWNLNKLVFGSGQPLITGGQLKKIEISLPPTIEEQQRIANALSDVDTLIANLEKLIAKKKNIKQGAMQQLLTGKKRLPGFAPDERRKECHSERSAKREVEESSGYKMTELGMIPIDWEFVPVSELAKDMADGPFGSNLKKEHYTSDPQTRIIQLSNIGENGWEDENTKYTTFEHAKTIARCIVPKEESILVAKMMPAGRAIICPKKEKQYVLGSDVIRITANEKLNSKYFVYASKSDAYLKQISDNTQGSTRQRTSISKLRKILILLPSLAEQTAFANVLSDMDTEISALETKLAKYRTLKTGMMQQLLTGKIRLV